MKVKDLIEKLKEFEGEKEIDIYCYECGMVRDITDIQVMGEAVEILVEWSST